MRDANGAGLAAIQVYEPIRIFAIEVKDNPRYPYKPNVPLTILVNPVLEPLTDETFENYEGCLSVPNLRGEVPRGAGRPGARAGTGRARTSIFEVNGLTAGTFQHEIDHLDGTLFVDRVVDTRTLCTWAEFERFHQARSSSAPRRIVAKWGTQLPGRPIPSAAVTRGRRVLAAAEAGLGALVETVVPGLRGAARVLARVPPGALLHDVPTPPRNVHRR